MADDVKGPSQEAELIQAYVDSARRIRAEMCRCPEEPEQDAEVCEACISRLIEETVQPRVDAALRAERERTLREAAERIKGSADALRDMMRAKEFGADRMHLSTRAGERYMVERELRALSESGAPPEARYSRPHQWVDGVCTVCGRHREDEGIRPCFGMPLDKPGAPPEEGR